MNKIIKVTETKKQDFTVSRPKNKLIDMQNTEETLNKFFIFDQDGNLCRDGHNIVLNIGRALSGARLLGRSIIIPAASNTTGVDITVSPSDTCYLRGFGLGNGAALPENNLSPREPLPSDPSMTHESGTVGWIPFTSTVPIPALSDDGKAYDLNAYIKLHIDANQPLAKLDETGFTYFEHTFIINENEVVGGYFNEIALFFQVIQGGTTFYVPYSKFVFAGLPNLGGKNSYTVLYGTYL